MSVTIKGDKPLEACPFCGGAATLERIEDEEKDLIGYMVECEACYATGPAHTARPHQEELARDAAIAQWNRRAPSILLAH